MRLAVPATGVPATPLPSGGMALSDGMASAQLSWSVLLHLPKDHMIMHRDQRVVRLGAPPETERDVARHDPYVPEEESEAVEPEPQPDDAPSGGEHIVEEEPEKVAKERRYRGTKSKSAPLPPWRSRWNRSSPSPSPSASPSPATEQVGPIGARPGKRPRRS